MVAGEYSDLGVHVQLLVEVLFKQEFVLVTILYLLTVEKLVKDHISKKGNVAQRFVQVCGLSKPWQQPLYACTRQKKSNIV